MTTLASSVAFEGFPRRGLEFLRDLESHNERVWFNERKGIYQEDVEKPLRALVTEIARRCARAKVPLAPNPLQPSFRIYRDVRFSADKRPYKTFAGAALYRDGDKTVPGSLYLHIDAREPFVGAGFYHPEKGTLDALRRGIVGDSSAFLKTVANLRKRDAPLLVNDTLLRLPRAFAESGGTNVEPYLKLRSLFADRELDATRLRSDILCDDIISFVKAVAPLLRWGWQQLA